MARPLLRAAISLIFVILAVVQAESAIARRTNETAATDKGQTSRDEGKTPATRSKQLETELQRKKRMTVSEDEEDEEEPAYLRVLGSAEDKRARISAFRGDLGKRMMAVSRTIPNEADFPFVWNSGKRMKVSSRFRGDLGKRARSSFRGDLGKRFADDTTPFDVIDDEVPSILARNSLDSLRSGGDDLSFGRMTGQGEKPRGRHPLFL